jgi:hypothetical protein
MTEAELIYKTGPGRVTNGDGDHVQREYDDKWNAWLRGHLDNERMSLLNSIGDALGAERMDARKETARAVEAALVPLLREIAELRAQIATVIALGAPQRAFRPCGGYDSKQRYEKLDVVTTRGSSFVAITNDPGSCPGEGWQLLAGRRSRGTPGERGVKGEMFVCSVRI